MFRTDSAFVILECATPFDSNGALATGTVSVCALTMAQNVSRHVKLSVSIIYTPAWRQAMLNEH